MPERPRDAVFRAGTRESLGRSDARALASQRNALGGAVVAEVVQYLILSHEMLAALAGTA
jgi:hypothetical protein